MTNFDYIISKVNKLTEHDLMFVLLYDESSSYNWLGKQIKYAYQNWVKTLPQNSPFVKEYEWEYIANFGFWQIPKKVGRTTNISFQVWLSKQYNPEEWGKKQILLRSKIQLWKTITLLHH